MGKFSPIKNRIIEVIENKGVTKYKFYKKSGMTRGVLDKTSGISEENIAKFIACFPDVNTNWLITGKGEMLKKEGAGGAATGELKRLQGENSILKEEVNELKDKLISCMEGRLQGGEEDKSKAG